MARLLFVYGTLRRGETNDINRFEPAPRYVGESRIRGYLYDRGTYPGLVLDGSGDWVVGEVYDIAPALEPQLDALEAEYPAAPDEFPKETVRLTVNDERESAIVYAMHKKFAAEATPIAGGDWVAYRRLRDAGALLPDAEDA
ncbi:gamma-glutamylcyclotransferase [Piscinibacterium candidicorallinum]|jgi:gamma-glutamylcyclotransferase (GGCT)/AIG2-like uncharacterized protein YtfP|uniref:Gamma-glutamylcyclotransferase n=1 Tax=Piscinibacterium candidicorallinum TaxID=1793872 RepID=A0ABV7H4E5_9BURK